MIPANGVQAMDLCGRKLAQTVRRGREGEVCPRHDLVKGEASGVTGRGEREDGQAAVEDGDHVPRGVAAAAAGRHPAEERGEAHVDRVEAAPLARGVEQLEAGRAASTRST